MKIEKNLKHPFNSWILAGTYFRYPALAPGRIPAHVPARILALFLLPKFLPECLPTFLTEFLPVYLSELLPMFLLIFLSFGPTRFPSVFLPVMPARFFSCPLQFLPRHVEWINFLLFATYFRYVFIYLFIYLWVWKWVVKLEMLSITIILQACEMICSCGVRIICKFKQWFFLRIFFLATKVAIIHKKM